MTSKIKNSKAKTLEYLLKTSEIYARTEKECRESGITKTADEFWAYQYGLQIAIDALQNQYKV